MARGVLVARGTGEVACEAAAVYGHPGSNYPFSAVLSNQKYFKYGTYELSGVTYYLLESIGSATGTTQNFTNPPLCRDENSCTVLSPDATGYSIPVVYIPSNHYGYFGSTSPPSGSSLGALVPISGFDAGIYVEPEMVLPFYTLRI